MATTINMIPAGDQPGYGPRRLSIYGKEELSQKFISNNKNLTAIGTTIKNPNLKNKKEVILNLYDNNNNLIRRSILNGFNIGDGDFVKFVFDVIPDSVNKEYLFTLSSPTAGADEIIEVFLMENPVDMDNPASGIIEYTFAEETFAGGIPLVTFHKPENKWEIIRGVYSNWLSKLLFPRSQKTK